MPPTGTIRLVCSELGMLWVLSLRRTISPTRSPDYLVDCLSGESPIRL
jgi:hypothetical protein